MMSEPTQRTGPPSDEARRAGRQEPPTDRLLLCVDGVGSFLLLTSEQVTVGRIGSSARCDVELAADLERVHAQFLRVDHDDFVVARGPVEVGGTRAERQLLSDGDRIVLGSRNRLTSWTNWT